MIVSLIFATIDPTILILIITALLGTGGVASFATLRKAGKEAESIATSTLIAVNEELRRELARRDDVIAQLRERIAILEKRMDRAENGHK